jgi:hypothetical protein
MEYNRRQENIEEDLRVELGLLLVVLGARRELVGLLRILVAVHEYLRVIRDRQMNELGQIENVNECQVTRDVQGLVRLMSEAEPHDYSKNNSFLLINC